MTDDPIEPSLQRQRDRLAAIPAVYKTQLERLACEIALKTRPAAELFPAYGYDPDAALELLESKSFQGLLTKIEAEVREGAISIKTKARMMVENLLPEAYSIADDPQIGAATRLDVMQWLGRLADVEPRKDKEGSAGGGGLNLHITFAGQEMQKVVTSEPLTIEAGG